MGTTIIGPTSARFPRPVYSPLLFICEAWADDWEYRPDIRLRRATWSSAGHDLSSCTISRAYGSVKQTYQSAYQTLQPLGDMRRWWVGVRLMGEGGWQTAFIGQIAGVSRDVYGDDAAPAGVQTWTAYGPEQILRLTDVSRSTWITGGAEQDLGWTPNVNARDEHGTLVGNRSAALSGDSYVFCGSNFEVPAVWTHRQYLDYLIARHLTSATGPVWTVGGRAEILDDLSEVIDAEGVRSVHDLLADLIPTRLGIDYTLIPTDDGFEISVYPLLSDDHTFAGVTLPKNENRVEVIAAQAPENISTRIVHSYEHQYDRLRIRGGRIVVCCSLFGLNFPGAPWPNSFSPKWDDALETLYKDGTGVPADSADDHDEARKAEKFRAVYASFGAPSNWDHNNGTAAPKFDAEGDHLPGQVADAQRRVRRTLEWLPLFEGFDYSVDPAVNNNVANHQPDLMAPQAWLGNWTGDFIPADYAGVGVSVSREDWGVFLTANPSHLLAGSLNPDWTGLHPTNYRPIYDHLRSACTIALESDQRLELIHDLVPDADARGGTKVIDVPDAELWYVAADTIVGLALDASPLLTPMTQITRDDSARLAAVMAGAIAEYGGPRSRATITARGLFPWAGLVGQILTVIETGDGSQEIAAPITSISWTVGDKDDVFTEIQAGFSW